MGAVLGRGVIASPSSGSPVRATCRTRRRQPVNASSAPADHTPKPTRGGLTSLALSCASNMPGRGREVQAEWPRTLDADRASFKALL